MKGLNGDAYRVSLSSSVSSSNQGSGHCDSNALGDAFIWGEGTCDGVLGGGIHRTGNSSDSPKNINVELVECGEYHSCAVSLSGEMYSWGGRLGNSGLLGHGSETSQRIPKNVNGSLEGIHAPSVSCGPWDTAVVTSTGQLFTFGDGTFGVLGHGDRKSVSVPREAEFLQGPTHCPSSLWCLAHFCCCVSVPVIALQENFLLGGTEIKVVLAMHDHCTYNQWPCLCYGKPCLYAFVESSSWRRTSYLCRGEPHQEFCSRNSFMGAFHVAVITSKTEVYTWGKGENGQLGHRDTDDRNSPFLVEALKDKRGQECCLWYKFYCSYVPS
ncbi:hypothetical protein V6N11_045037 [Hibiscus sabdariffa]|uniref:Uncharacterized protein n=2 Tax=Hibiscus sabdariffa TaxID=183260 RepID=A0ABR2A8R5_9ROSI